jgi:hypothetical protein
MRYLLRVHQFRLLNCLFETASDNKITTGIKNHPSLLQPLNTLSKPHSAYRIYYFKKRNRSGRFLQLHFQVIMFSADSENISGLSPACWLLTSKQRTALIITQTPIPSSNTSKIPLTCYLFFK